MRKQKHPYRLETMLQLKDGSFYLKRWLYFRSTLALDIDTTTNFRWKKILFKSKQESRFLAK